MKTWGCCFCLLICPQCNNIRLAPRAYDPASHSLLAQLMTPSLSSTLWHEWVFNLVRKWLITLIISTPVLSHPSYYYCEGSQLLKLYFFPSLLPLFPHLLASNIPASWKLFIRVEPSRSVPAWFVHVLYCTYMISSAIEFYHLVLKSKKEQ